MAEFNPFSAPEIDAPLQSHQETYLIQRSDHGLYLEDAIILPHYCVCCGRRGQFRQVFTYSSFIKPFSQPQFRLKYWTCWRHFATNLFMEFLQALIGVFAALFLFSGLISVNTAVLFAALACGFIYFLIQRYIVIKGRFRVLPEAEGTEFKVSGFAYEFLNRFHYRK